MSAVLLDAGHGGVDSGCIGAGVKEKDLTLDYALRIGRGLKALDVEVFYTRMEDRLVPVQEIVDEILKGKPDVFVSIHSNSGVRDMRGVEVYAASSEHVASKRLAADIRLAVCGGATLFDRGTKFRRQLLFSSIGKRVAAVQVELGFLTNSYDRAVLLDNRPAIVRAMVAAIQTYLER